MDPKTVLEEVIDRARKMADDDHVSQSLRLEAIKVMEGCAVQLDCMARDDRRNYPDGVPMTEACKR